MNTKITRRSFVKQSLALAGVAWAAPSLAPNARAAGEPLFKISLAQWSFHRAIQGGRLDPLDFAKTARNDFDIEAVEYVNQFFMDKAKDQAFLNELKKRADDHGVKSLLIMCDREGNLGDPDDARRAQAVENHYKWAEAARFLGCHSIRVNAASSGSYEEQVQLAADGLARLSKFAVDLGLNVLVENHGGLSSNGAWLAKVMETVNMRNCGTLPDFGNFTIGRDEQYDRYQGVRELMPYARAVSAKSYDFNELGNETTIDYYRMMKIVLEAGYRGYVGIEYEGRNLGEPEGVAKTKQLLEKVRGVLG